MRHWVLDVREVTKRLINKSYIYDWAINEKASTFYCPAKLPRRYRVHTLRRSLYSNTTKAGKVEHQIMWQRRHEQAE